MINIKKVILILVALFVCAGCEIELVSKLYTQDLVEVLNGNTKLTTPVNIHLEIPSPDWIKDNKNKKTVRNFIQKRMGKVGAFSTIERGLSTFLVAPIKVPILPQSESSEGIFEFLVGGNDEDPKLTDISFKINKAKFEDFSRDIEEEFYNKISPEEIAIILDVHNDLAGNVTIYAYSSYIDGDPFPGAGGTVLERRESAKISVSKIHAAYLGKKGRSVLLSFQNSAN